MSNTVRKSLHNVISEVVVAPEVKRLKLVKVPEIAEDVADAGNVPDGIVLERKLDQFFTVFQLSEELVGNVRADNLVFNDKAVLTCHD